MYTYTKNKFWVMTYKFNFSLKKNIPWKSRRQEKVFGWGEKKIKSRLRDLCEKYFDFVLEILMLNLLIE